MDRAITQGLSDAKGRCWICNCMLSYEAQYGGRQSKVVETHDDVKLGWSLVRGLRCIFMHTIPALQYTLMGREAQAGDLQVNHSRGRLDILMGLRKELMKAT